MSYETPILTGGGPSNQSIYQAVTDPRHQVGTRAALHDGRVFYYACNRSSAIDAGVLVQMTGISVDFDDLATNTASENDTSVTVTPVGSATYTKDQLAGGWLSVNSGTTGAGRQYKIAGHPATSAATAFDIELAEPIRDEDFNANTTATVVPNPWSEVVIADVSSNIFVVGATVFDVPAGSTNAQYFWAQTWGVATVLAAAGSDVVGHQIIKATSTDDGQYLGWDESGTGVVTQTFGLNLFTSVDGDYMPVFLQIAP